MCCHSYFLPVFAEKQDRLDVSGDHTQKRTPEEASVVGSNVVTSIGPLGLQVGGNPEAYPPCHHGFRCEPGPSFKGITGTLRILLLVLNQKASIGHNKHLRECISVPDRALSPGDR